LRISGINRVFLVACQKQPESVKLFSTISTWKEALRIQQQ
jgi:hypothetical protein